MGEHIEFYKPDNHKPTTKWVSKEDGGKLLEFRRADGKDNSGVGASEDLGSLINQLAKLEADLKSETDLALWGEASALHVEIQRKIDRSEVTQDDAVSLRRMIEKIQGHSKGA